MIKEITSNLIIDKKKNERPKNILNISLMAAKYSSFEMKKYYIAYQSICTSGPEYIYDFFIALACLFQKLLPKTAGLS